jgi:hypothetical protein
MTIKNNILQFNNQQLSVLTGGLLGDLSLRFSGRNWKISSGTQYEIFKDFTRTPPKQDSLKRWSFNTLIINELKDIGPLWYPNATVKSIGIKVMPFHFIDRYFNSLSLATLFMGDGSKRDSGYVFCLDNFQIQEVKWFSEFLYNKFSLESNLWINKRNHPRLYIPSRSKDLFNFLVEPYLVKSQTRKLIKQPARKLILNKKSQDFYKFL